MGFGGTSPCAQTKGDKVFIDKHPEDMLKDGDFAPKDIVFGANKHEGSFVLGGMISCIYLPKIKVVNKHCERKSILREHDIP